MSSSKASTPLPTLGMAYGPWLHDGTIRSVWLIEEYRAADDELVVRYVGKQRLHGDPSWVRHTGPAQRMLRSVESFGSVHIHPACTRPSAPWPRHMPTVHLDDLVLDDSIAAMLRGDV